MMRICGKGPPTNTAETPLFCIGKVKKQLLFTENLRLRQGMGEFYLFPAIFCLFRLGIFWVILRSVARQVFWKTWLVRLAAGGGFCRCLRRGREKVCYHLRWGEIFRKLGLYACPAGAYFCSYKSRQNTLGALPQDPGRWLCWIRIDFRREPKINPYCAQNRSQGSLRQHLPFPPTPFPDGGKGARMGWQVGTERDALGVLGPAKSASHRP